MRLACGTASLMSSSCRGAMFGTVFDTPVMLKPGRARLFAKPLPTGSNAATKTIGTVEVRLRAASIAVVCVATITSTLASSRSLTIEGRRSA